MIAVVRKPRTILATAVATALAATALAAAPPRSDAARNLSSCGFYLAEWNYWTNELYRAYIAAGEILTPYAEYAARMANDAMDDFNAAGCA